MNNSDMPASPVKLSHEQFEFSETVHTGLTKREYFAVLAMQGYLSGTMAWSDGLDGGGVTPSDTEVAKESVAYADALLKELEK